MLMKLNVRQLKSFIKRVIKESTEPYKGDYDQSIENELEAEYGKLLGWFDAAEYGKRLDWFDESEYDEPLWFQWRTKHRSRDVPDPQIYPAPPWANKK